MSKLREDYLIKNLYPSILATGGVVGLIAMTWQSVERINMLKNPGNELSCSLNPIIDCSGVLGNKLAAVLGFPNAFLGMIFFTILATSGLFLLSGGKFKSWYSHFVIAVSTILILFSVWFFYVSLYILGSVCIFCIFGWVVSVPMFWYGLLYYMQELPSVKNLRLKNLRDFGLKHHLDVILLVYAIMLALFLLRFRGYYFG